MEWEFGAGLSYTTFAYSNLLLSTNTINEDESVVVTVTVTNTGLQYTATDTVLVFLFDMFRRVTPEYKLLKRFAICIKLIFYFYMSCTLSLLTVDLKY